MKLTNSIFKLLFIICIVTIANAREFNLFFVDIDNRDTLIKYLNTKDFKVGYNDAYVVLDSKSSQLIYANKFTSYNLIDKYNQNRGKFKQIILNSISTYHKTIDIFLKDKQSTNAIAKEKNDFARQLKSAKNYIKAYRSKYDNFRVVFFGDSYMHSAYGHIFAKGVPSDGFIYLRKSEFNTFEDIDIPNAKFAIFFDIDPRSDNKKVYRFYKKLFKKKFNANLNTFNKDSVFDSRPKLDSNDKPFMPKIVKVIEDKPPSDCAERDKITKNRIDVSAEVEIEIVNECRKNTILSFSHNGITSQVLVDVNGRGVKRFKLMIHHNTIQYKNLNGDWTDIIDENVPVRQDNVNITLDAATSTAIIEGRNPLREEGSQFPILYENIGSTLYPEIQNGTFKEVVPIKVGDNVFSWKDMNGVKHSKTIVFDPKCTDKVDFDKNLAEEYAILQLTLENSCREDGSLATFIYNDKKYLSVMQDGKTDANIILSNDVNEVFYEDFDRNRQKLATITIRDFADLIRFMISYSDNVIVAMNVFEPNIGLDITSPIYGVDYDDSTLFKDGHLHVGNKKSNNGDILIAEMPSTGDYLKENFVREYKQVYITRRSKQTSGELYFYVDYFSRHGLYNHQPALCGKRSLGGVSIDYEVLFDGSSQLGEKFLNPANCTNSTHSKEDEEIVLIKKVNIK